MKAAVAIERHEFVARRDKQVIARRNCIAAAGVTNGKLDFAQLLLFRRETIEARRGYIEALDELNRAEAQLSRTLGRLP